MINVDQLTKHYQIQQSAATFKGLIQALGRSQKKTIIAVDQLTFSVPEGTIAGLVGLNGAGKSTLIKLLTGVISQTHGHCQVNGLRPFKDRLRYVQNIGVVFGQRTQMIWDLPVRHSLEILQHIYQVPAKRFRDNLAWYCDLFGVSEFIDRPVRLLSLGQRMRAELVSAVLHDPKVLFLDEPTIGLDILVKKQIRQAIQDMNRQRGTTVILTSHDLDDIDSLCQQLIVLDQGRILFDGNKQSFIEHYRGQKNIHLTLAEHNIDIRSVLQQWQAQTVDEHRYILTVNEHRQSCSELIKELVNQLPITDLSIEEPGLEEVLQSIY